MLQTIHEQVHDMLCCFRPFVGKLTVLQNSHFLMKDRQYKTYVPGQDLQMVEDKAHHHRHGSLKFTYLLPIAFFWLL